MTDTRPTHLRVGRELLNIQYSVFLGVTLSLSFFVDSTSSPIVQPVMNLVARPEALLLLVYFLLDWFTTNVVEERRFPTPGHLFLRITWIAVLGVTAISMNSLGNWKLYLLAFYLGASGIYDLVFLRRLLSADPRGEMVRGMLLAGSRMAIATIMLIPVALAAFGRVDALLFWDNPSHWNDGLFFLILTYVGLKAGRFYYLARLVPATVEESQ